mmetsp:Transcript_3072/g.4530  ORF Transcript_3072/g.4530 Transcript_3072/m.4530 type:complete len:90 (+) Transcript_3072:5444-5713(+)
MQLRDFIILVNKPRFYLSNFIAHISDVVDLVELYSDVVIPPSLSEIVIFLCRCQLNDSTIEISKDGRDYSSERTDQNEKDNKKEQHFPE